MAIFDRFNIKVLASAGLFGAAIAMSPDAAAMPLKTGGACIQGQAGEVAPLPAAGGMAGAGAPAVAGVCGGAAPMTDMAGVPMAFPGPVPVVPLAPVPLVPPVPVVPAGVPVGAPLPIGAPLVAMGGDAPGAPLVDMSGVKDAPTGPAPTGGPVPGQPLQPGPGARPPS